MFNKLIYLMLFCTLEASNIIRKANIYILKTMFKKITSTPNTVSNWINKLRLHHTKKRRNTSHGSGKFSQNLRASKNLWYNVRNCKSGRHGHQHTFRKHKSQTRHTITNSSNTGLSIKSRKSWIFKSPPPQRQDWMLCAILHCENCHYNNND